MELPVHFRVAVACHSSPVQMFVSLLLSINCPLMCVVVEQERDATVEEMFDNRNRFEGCFAQAHKVRTAYCITALTAFWL